MDTVFEGHSLMTIKLGEVTKKEVSSEDEVDLIGLDLTYKKLLTEKKQAMIRIDLKLSKKDMAS